MTTYNAKGLPTFEATDKIAAPGDGLREDLNLVAASASAAIGVEGSRAEGAAKSYADTKDTANRAAWAAADTTTLNSAKSYTDSKDTANRAAWAAADTAKLADAKTYTDTKDTANRSAWAAADTSKLAEAKAYADSGLSADRVRLTSLEAVSPKVSNIALDTDGNPYYSPGSTQVHVIQDGDGEPYYITFLQASADEDGAPYF